MPGVAFQDTPCEADRASMGSQKLYFLNFLGLETSKAEQLLREKKDGTALLAGDSAAYLAPAGTPRDNRKGGN